MNEVRVSELRTPEKPSDALSSLEQALGYRFSDRLLLLQALTHSSYTHEQPGHPPHNERLEFLGDAVLQFAVTTALLERLPEAPEGTLSKLRAALVSAPRLFQIAESLSLRSLLRVGKGMGREARYYDQPALLADTVEAIFGAVYLDGGIDRAVPVVDRLLGDALNQVGEAPDLLWRDPKTALQELSMKEFGEWPRYQDIGSEGPPNDRTFSVSVSIRGTTIATGVGRKKKAAQQNAAREALERISLGWLPGNPEVGPDE